MSSLQTWHKLFSNHMDAWVVALVSGSIALLVHGVFQWSLLYLLSAITLGYWAGFALNDYFDAPYDAHDPKKAQRSFFVQNKVSPFVFVCAILLLIGYTAPAFLQFGWMGGGLLGICYFMAWAYSAPPLRLKNRPILDLITHTFFVETYPYLIILIALGVSWTNLDYIILGCAALASLSAQLEQQLRDFELDRQYERNFTTTFGFQTSAFLLKLTTLLLMSLFGIALLTKTIPLLIIPLGLVNVPIVTHRLFRDPSQPRSLTLTYVTALAGVTYLLFLLFVQP